MYSNVNMKNITDLHYNHTAICKGFEIKKRN